MYGLIRATMGLFGAGMAAWGSHAHNAVMVESGLILLFMAWGIITHLERPPRPGNAASAADETRPGPRGRTRRQRRGAPHHLALLVAVAHHSEAPRASVSSPHAGGGAARAIARRAGPPSRAQGWAGPRSRTGSSRSPDWRCWGATRRRSC